MINLWYLSELDRFKCFLVTLHIFIRKMSKWEEEEEEEEEQISLKSRSRWPVDYFVKTNTHNAELFPASQHAVVNIVRKLRENGSL